MEDNNLESSSPNNSVNHTNTKENEKAKNKKIIISIILVTLILGVILCIAYNLFFKKDKFNLKEEVFTLSDKSTLHSSVSSTFSISKNPIIGTSFFVI